MADELDYRDYTKHVDMLRFSTGWIATASDADFARYCVEPADAIFNELHEMVRVGEAETQAGRLWTRPERMEKIAVALVQTMRIFIARAVLLKLPGFVAQQGFRKKGDMELNGALGLSVVTLDELDVVEQMEAQFNDVSRKAGLMALTSAVLRRRPSELLPFVRNLAENALSETGWRDLAKKVVKAAPRALPKYEKRSAELHTLSKLVLMAPEDRDRLIRDATAAAQQR